LHPHEVQLQLEPHLQLFSPASVAISNPPNSLWAGPKPMIIVSVVVIFSSKSMDLFPHLQLPQEQLLPQEQDMFN
jgi:hypothetical protein